MKNVISRRSFLKAVGALSAAGALAACGGKPASTSTAASTSSFYCCFHCRFRLCIRRKHQAVDIPHRRLGQGRDRAGADRQLQRKVS